MEGGRGWENFWSPTVTTHVTRARASPSQGQATHPPRAKSEGRGQDPVPRTPGNQGRGGGVLRTPLRRRCSRRAMRYCRTITMRVRAWPARVSHPCVCAVLCVWCTVCCVRAYTHARAGESGPSPESPLRRMDPAEEGSPALPDHVVRVISYFPRRDDAMAPTRAQAMPCVGCGVGCGVGGRRAAQRCRGGVSLLP